MTEMLGWTLALVCFAVGGWLMHRANLWQRGGWRETYKYHPDAHKWRKGYDRWQ